MKTFILKNKPLAIAYGCCLLLFLIQFLPYVIRPDAYIRIHDTLEGEWLWFSSLVDYGVALDTNMDTMIPSFLGGLPRFLFPSGLSFTVLFIYLFGTVGGYIVSSFVVHLIGFFGAYLLFRKYVFTEEDEKHWPVLIAALFSIIPLFITFGASVSGQPLLLFACLNVLNKKTKYWEYLVILAFPFYANIVWSAAFVNLMLVGVFLYSYKKEYATLKFFLLLGLMNAVYLGINYHLVYATFMADLPLQRDEYKLAINEIPGFLKSIGETFYILFIGSFHVGTFVTLPIFILGCFNLRNKAVKYLMIMAISIALLNGFYLFIVPILEKIHPFIISFNIKRIKILLPFIWMGILAFSIKDMHRFPRGKQLSYFVIFCMILSTLFANDEIINNYRNWLGYQRKPDANQFFATKTFDQIDRFIAREKKDYRVAHLGLNPTISQHNGFLTIDGLQAMYPLEHKNLMKEIMRGELDKDYKLVRYFDAWGNRCYLFSSELGKENNAFMIDKDQDVSIEHWSIDTKLLKANEVDYIFSTVVIKNADELNLSMDAIFKNKDDFWKIYLYRILD